MQSKYRVIIILQTRNVDVLSSNSPECDQYCNQRASTSRQNYTAYSDTRDDEYDVGDGDEQFTFDDETTTHLVPNSGIHHMTLTAEKKEQMTNTESKVHHETPTPKVHHGMSKWRKAMKYTIFQLCHSIFESFLKVLKS